MLFAYPVNATADNWVNDCLSEMLRVSIDALNARRRVPTWPDIIPEQYRPRLRGRSGVKKRFGKLVKDVRRLPQADRNQLLLMFASQNNFPHMFDGVTDCPDKAALPAGVVESVDDLMRFSFGLLSDFGIRDDQYAAIHAGIASRVCPFCGCEYFEAPGAPRHHLDHYLAISRYPFAGTNLRNLVPMGSRCNSVYKRNQDILFDAQGQRRRCFDPYGQVVSAVSLAQSRPFEGHDGRLPKWVIELGQTPEAQTWDAVWHVKRRYSRDVLDSEYFNWLEHFAQWCRATNKMPGSRQAILATLDDFIATVIPQGFADRAFLKRAVFEMLRDRAAQSERLADFLIDVASPDLGAAA
jgi:hypothetical protein